MPEGVVPLEPLQLAADVAQEEQVIAVDAPV